MSRLPVAVNMVALDEISQDGNCLDADIPHALGVIATNQVIQRRLVASITRNYLAATAAGSAPTNSLCFQQHYLEASLS
jgi:hypothetical protein